MTYPRLSVMFMSYTPDPPLPLVCARGSVFPELSSFIAVQPVSTPRNRLVGGFDSVLHFSEFRFEFFQPAHQTTEVIDGLSNSPGKMPALPGTAALRLGILRSRHYF